MHSLFDMKLFKTRKPNILHPQLIKILQRLSPEKVFPKLYVKLKVFGFFSGL